MTSMTDSHTVLPGNLRTVSILSGKGGVGKSVIALNLAERAASHGRRVLLVDVDFSGGNLHILANVAPRQGLAAYLGGEVSIDQVVVPITDRCDLLAHPDSLPPGTSVTVKEIARFASRLQVEAAAYDLIIMDHGSGVSEQATVLASASDLNLLIAIPELTSIADCYGLYKFLTQANRSVVCRLLINRVEDAEEADFVATRLGAMTRQFLGRPLPMLAFLPEDRSLRRAIAGQCPLAQIGEQSPVLQGLNETCRALVGGLPTATPVTPDTVINENAAPADIRG